MKILSYLLLLCVRNAFSGKIYPWSKVKEEKKLICRTKQCEEIGEMYMKHLDHKKNPCTDFYEYACGNWEKMNPIPLDADEWGARALQQEKVAYELKPILENEAKHSKLGQTYEACTRRPSLRQISIHNLLKYVEKIDVWPMSGTKVIPTTHPWWAIDSYYISQTGESALFDIHIAHSDKERDFPLFQLRPLLSAYGRFIRLYVWETSEIEAYIEFLNDLIDASSQHKTGKTIVSKKDITNVISFRFDLDDIAVKASQNKMSIIRLTIKDLQRMFEKELVKSSPKQIDWLTIMRSIYENNSPDSINMKTEVEVRQYEYFASLAKLLNKTPEDVIVNHIHLYFIEKHLRLDHTWRNKLMDVLYTDKPCVEKQGGIRRLNERWITCLFNLRTSVDFNKLFVEKFLSPSAKKTAENVALEIKSVLALEISDSDWLNAETKDKSISKVRDMQAWIGYPVWYDIPKLKHKFKDVEMTPIEANACQLYDYNTIFLPAGTISPPLGCISDAFPATYATIGFSLAHESYHAFDTDGITYNAKGKSHKSWWSNPMLKTYDVQKRCFMDQYAHFLIQELKVKHPKQCDVVEAYDENMADIMGVKLAYQVYRKALFDNQGICKMPSHLKDFTCDQLFFIAYANTQCSSVTSNSADYGTVAYSSPRYRVNGPLMNLEEFSKAFHCKQNDVMQLPPASRCDLWRTKRQ